MIRAIVNISTAGSPIRQLLKKKQKNILPSKWERACRGQVYRNHITQIISDEIGKECSISFFIPIALDVGAMTDRDELHDPLKSLDQIYEPDGRQISFTASLEERHAALKEIVLNDTVPLEVRQLFETAKNLSLYSWFVYRFHQVSELISFSALEMALRERYLAENPIDEKLKKNRAPSLYALIQHANTEGWLANEGFSDSYQVARQNAEFKKMIEKSKTHDFDKEPSMPIDEPSEEEIAEALVNLDRIKSICENAHKIRNDLAHGSKTLHPNSISTLRINADVINQIYPKYIAKA